MAPTRDKLFLTVTNQLYFVPFFVNKAGLLAILAKVLKLQ